MSQASTIMDMILITKKKFMRTLQVLTSLLLFSSFGKGAMLFVMDEEMFLRLEGKEDPNLSYVIKDFFKYKTLVDTSPYEHLLKTGSYIKDSLILDANYNAIAGIYKKGPAFTCFYISLDKEEFRQAIDILKQRQESTNRATKKNIRYIFHEMQFNKI